LKGLHSLIGAKLLLPGKQVEQYGGASFDLGHAELGWRQHPHKLCVRIRPPGGERNVSTTLIQPGLEFRLGWSGWLCGIELSEAAGFLV